MKNIDQQFSIHLCFFYSFVGGWIFQHESKTFYGMAINGNSYSKVGIDSDGNEVTPETRTFIPDARRERESIESFRKYLPKVLSPLKFCIVIVM